MIKHIWKYLTSPIYRAQVNLHTRDEDADYEAKSAVVLDLMAQDIGPKEPQKVKPRPNQY